VVVTDPFILACRDVDSGGSPLRAPDNKFLELKFVELRRPCMSMPSSSYHGSSMKRSMHRRTAGGRRVRSANDGEGCHLSCPGLNRLPFNSYSITVGLMECGPGCHTTRTGRNDFLMKSLIRF
jgi:hypothetical protein